MNVYMIFSQEKIRDLLDENRVKVNLTIREDKLRGIYIVDVTEVYCTSYDELLGLISAGAQNRAKAATGMNEGSSRSHSVFTVTVTQKDTAKGSTISGKLVLVDLAGSEMVRKTNASGQQLEEAKTINKSLSALGQVINALTDEKMTHVPYRDSKLTRILQDSLGGNSKTVLIVACSPSTFNASETVSTLRFGMRAKSIQNKVTVNQTRSVEELENLLLRAENAIDAQYTHIQTLTAQLVAYKEMHGEGVGSGDGSGGNEETQRAIEQLEQRIEALQIELQDEQAESSRKSAEVEDLTTLLKEKEDLMQEAGEVMLEAQKRYETQKLKADTASRELESLRAQHEEDMAQLKFKLEEAELTSDTLQKENASIASELQELSGANRNNGIVLENVKKPSPQATKMSETTSIVSSSSSDFSLPTPSSTMDVDDSNPVSSNVVPIETIMEELKVLLGDLSVTVEVDSKVTAFMERQLQAKNFIIEALEMRNRTTSQHQHDASRRISELEMQRMKLESDLQNVSETNLNNEVLLNTAVLPGNKTAARDNAQMKNLQHRLEQLVAVHRQLLRKYGSLELENTEVRKKLEIRDSRIKHLEGKGITIALRQQAERHAAELSALRDQVQAIENEHKVSPTKSTLHHDSQRQTGPRTIRGGVHANSSPSISREPSDTNNVQPKSPKSSPSTSTNNGIGGVFSRLGFSSS